MAVAAMTDRHDGHAQRPPVTTTDAGLPAARDEYAETEGNNSMKAQAGNRWVIAVAGAVMQVALGAVYAWSVFWDGRIHDLRGGAE